MLHPKGQAPILQHSNTADFFFSHSSPFHSINIHNILCDRQQQQNWLGERKKKWETGWMSWTKWIKIWMQEAPCREGNFDPDYVTYLEDDDHWNIKILIRIIFLAPWIHHKIDHRWNVHQNRSRQSLVPIQYSDYVNIIFVLQAWRIMLAAYYVYWYFVILNYWIQRDLITFA